jgi:hypothetical protein
MAHEDNRDIKIGWDHYSAIYGISDNFLSQNSTTAKVPEKHRYRVKGGFL